MRRSSENWTLETAASVTKAFSSSLVKQAAEKKKKGRCWEGYKPVKGKKPFSDGSCEKTASAWQRNEGKDLKKGGLNRKGVEAYRRENPGSKLKMAVTKKPSELKAGSKAANRRKSFCARMGGMPGPMKDEKGRPTRKALSLRKWNC